MKNKKLQCCMIMMLCIPGSLFSMDFIGRVVKAVQDFSIELVTEVDYLLATPTNSDDPVDSSREYHNVDPLISMHLSCEEAKRQCRIDQDANTGQPNSAMPVKSRPVSPKKIMPDTAVTSALVARQLCDGRRQNERPVALNVDALRERNNGRPQPVVLPNKKALIGNSAHQPLDAESPKGWDMLD